MKVNDFIKRIESDTTNLYLIQAEEEGLDCWHYVLVDKLKVPLLKQKMTKVPCQLDLTQFGKVVRSGWGTEPKPEVKAKVESGDYSLPPKEGHTKIFHINNEQNGKPFHVFISVKWEMADKFEYVAMYVGNIDLTQWGEVLEIGWGNAPEDRIAYYNSLGKEAEMA